MTYREWFLEFFARLDVPQETVETVMGRLCLNERLMWLMSRWDKPVDDHQSLEATASFVIAVVNARREEISA